MTTKDLPPEFADLQKKLPDLKRELEIADEILKHDPSLGITAFIMATDIMSGERIEAAIEAKFKMDGNKPLTYERGINLVGSYARFEWAYKHFQLGHISKNYYYKNLPSLWSGSDPDDTDPKYLRLWKDAFKWNGNKTLLDNKRKPLPQEEILTVYRGQDVGATTGIAWSLDFAIAQKFARGAGVRQHNRRGEVIYARVERRRVMAYITGRGEEELIINPIDLLTH